MLDVSTITAIIRQILHQNTQREIYNNDERGLAIISNFVFVCTMVNNVAKNFIYCCTVQFDNIKILFTNKCTLLLNT